MELDTRLLRYFVAVAEELNFTRAARRLHISQPPLSLAMQQLEQQLGARLLLRSSRRVALTEAGRALHREALQLLRRHVEVGELIGRIDAGLRGQVRIGYVGSMLYRGLPGWLHHCRRRYPDVAQILLELNSAEQIDLLARGALDLGFIHANPLPEGLLSQALMSEPFLLCLPATHPRAGAPSLALEGLADDEFIFFSHDLSPSYHETLRTLCLQAGFTPRLHCEARHWLNVLSLVSQGLGVSIVPACLARAGMAGLHFAEFAHAQRSVSSLVWSEAYDSRIREQHVAQARAHLWA